MKIMVKQIPPEGLAFSEKIEPQALALSEDDLKFSAPLQIKGKAERAGHSVLVNLNVKTTLSLFCARCLEAVAHSADEDMDLDYPVDKNTEFIDIDEDIRQEVIVRLPLKVLCRKDCKGLCPGCGANLNNERCKCSEKIK